MQGLDLARLERRADADEALADAVPEPDRAQLPPAEPPPRRRLLAWRLNLDVLGRDLDQLGGWPDRPARRRAPYDGPVLWVAGETLATTSRTSTPTAMDRCSRGTAG